MNQLGDMTGVFCLDGGGWTNTVSWPTFYQDVVKKGEQTFTGILKIRVECTFGHKMENHNSLRFRIRTSNQAWRKKCWFHNILMSMSFAMLDAIFNTQGLLDAPCYDMGDPIIRKWCELEDGYVNCDRFKTPSAFKSLTPMGRNMDGHN